MKPYPATICLALFTVTCLLVTSTALAQDCRQIDINIPSQGGVDQFQVLYGPCDRVSGSLNLAGEGIRKLDGLRDLVEIGGSLIIDDTANLADLDGLQNLRHIGADIGIFHNRGLQSLNGLDSLQRVDGSIGFFSNPELADLGGMTVLTSVAGFVVISDSESLTNLDGLSTLQTVGEHMIINFNDELQDLSGLRNLTSVGGQLIIKLNPHLTHLDGLYRLAHIGQGIEIRDNESLADLQGLAGLQNLGGNVRVLDNPTLNNCGALRPFVGQLEQFRFARNAEGCNSVSEMKAQLEALQINAGFTDAWLNTVTPGQGFFVVVIPVTKQVFLGWFTYDLERPDDTVTARFGEPGHRWLTALGDFADRSADLEITLTRGGIFDAAVPQAANEHAGSMLLEFSSCSVGTVHFNLPGQSLSGAIPIRRLAPDNESLCQTLQ